MGWWCETVLVFLTELVTATAPCNRTASLMIQEGNSFEKRFAKRRKREGHSGESLRTRLHSDLIYSKPRHNKLAGRPRDSSTRCHCLLWCFFFVVFLSLSTMPSVCGGERLPWPSILFPLSPPRYPCACMLCKCARVSYT